MALIFARVAGPWDVPRCASATALPTCGGRGLPRLAAATFARPSPVSSGGGIDNTGTLTVSGSTPSGNSTGSEGGGLFNYKQGKLTISPSVVCDNVAPLAADPFGYAKLSNSTVGVVVS